MRPWISPARTVMETPSTALTPPKYRSRPRNSRSAPPSAVRFGRTASSEAGAGKDGGAMRNSLARKCAAKPIRPSGKPTTTANSIRAKIALRQSSVFSTMKLPTTRIPMATTGASAWNGRVVFFSRPRAPAARATNRPIAEMAWNSSRLDSRLGSRAIREAPTRAPQRLLRPPSTTPRSRITIRSQPKLCGWRYWKLKAYSPPARPPSPEARAKPATLWR